MYASMIFIIIYGAMDQGGFMAVWQRNVEGGRAQLIDLDPNPTTRHTLWTLVIGGYFTWITIYGVNQAQVRYDLQPPFSCHAEGGTLYPSLQPSYGRYGASYPILPTAGTVHPHTAFLR